VRRRLRAVEEVVLLPKPPDKRIGGNDAPGNGVAEEEGVVPIPPIPPPPPPVVPIVPPVLFDDLGVPNPEIEDDRPNIAGEGGGDKEAVDNELNLV
tara:strand:- start:87 stop:374 length:288 start_codon:yes stop_codon:yes gene_type:complete